MVYKSEHSDVLKVKLNKYFNCMSMTHSEISFISLISVTKDGAIIIIAEMIHKLGLTGRK